MTYSGMTNSERMRTDVQRQYDRLTKRWGRVEYCECGVERRLTRVGDRFKCLKCEKRWKP
jgi:hypothetical protein